MVSGVPVAVWQPCELLYTCYLLTYLRRECCVANNKTAAVPAQVLCAVDDVRAAEVCTFQFVHHERLTANPQQTCLLLNSNNTRAHSSGRSLDSR